MPRSAVRAALAAAVFAAVAVTPAPAEVTGNVNGEAEDPIIKSIGECYDAEEQAYLVVNQVVLTGAKKMPEAFGVAFLGHMTEAIDCLTAARDAVASDGPYQPNTLSDKALKDLDAALKLDILARSVAQAQGDLKFVMRTLLKATSLKSSAAYALASISTSRRDLAAIAANTVPIGTFTKDGGDIKSTKDAVKVAKSNIEDGSGDVNGVKGTVKKEPEPFFSALTSALTLAAEAPPAPNKYYSFEGTGSSPGYMFKSFGRRLFGPFEVRFQVGMFDPRFPGDTGSACIELDLEGSSPLQYFATCGRRISGGVQVFAQGNDGAAGNTFFEGAAVVEVVIAYDGTTFTCSAKPRGASDEDLVPFATYSGLPQGETALIGGLGASGMTKGAPIGLDEIFVTAK